MKQSYIARATSCLLLLICTVHCVAHAQQALHKLAGTHDVSGASFSKDGSLLIVSGSSSITIYDAGTETVKAIIPAAGKTSIAISPDNNTLLVGNSNNELVIYNLQNGANARQESKRTLQTHISSIDFRSDGRYYAIGTDDGRIAVIDAQHPGNFTTVMETVPFLDKKKGSFTPVSNLRFAGNDRIMAFAQNGEVKAFDVNSGRQVYALEYYHNVIYSPTDDAPVQCDLAPDAKRLLCSRSGNAFVLDLDTYNIIGRNAQAGIRTSAIAPSGNLILACDASHVYVYNGDLTHKAGNELSVNDLSGKGNINAVLISPSANKVVLCSGNDIFIADFQHFQKLAGK